MAGAFGLLHGLGFAGALSVAGLPADEVPLSLLGFNLGIEAGQLLLIGFALAATALWRCGAAAICGTVRGAAARLAAVYMMGGIAACWCFERGFALVF
jgi:hypothetical protein